MNDWTCDEHGRTNSSALYLQLCAHVESIIRRDAHQLLSGNAQSTARTIVSQLAHVHGLQPSQSTAAD
jgi:hypothetical protein